MSSHSSEQSSVHLSNVHDLNHEMGWLAQLLLISPFILAFGLYIWAAFKSSRHYKPWPVYRTFLWTVGIFCIVISLIGPLAEQAHENFMVHMIGHLLLGMLAPLLLAMARPMTLLLRTLKVNQARRLSNFFKSWPVRFWSNPVIASLLNMGGLWVLYTTDLYMLMQENFLLHLFIHLHVFLAGYLFTISMIYFDPTPHRYSFLYRAIVLVFALAAHQILSKYIYAFPPSGVALREAQIGGMLMYYGGDAIDIVIIYILCFQWYRAARPRTSIKKLLDTRAASNKIL